MRDDPYGMLLIIVRRQPMIVGDDERFKERPGLAGQLAKKGDVIMGQVGAHSSDRSTHPPGKGR